MSPVIEIPVREVKEIPKLKNDEEFREAASELCRLSDEEDRITSRIRELRPVVTAALKAKLREEEKSVLFRRTFRLKDGTTRIKAYRLTVVEREHGNMILDKTKLLKYITAKKLEKCYTEGKKPEPTVSVNPVED